MEKYYEIRKIDLVSLIKYQIVSSVLVSMFAYAILHALTKAEIYHPYLNLRTFVTGICTNIIVLDIYILLYNLIAKKDGGVKVKVNQIEEGES